MINDKIIGNIRKLFVTNKAKIDSLGGQSSPFEFHSQPFGSSECAFVSSQSTLAISPVQFGYSFLLDQSSLRRQNLDGKLRGYSTSRQIESAKVGDTVAEGTADTHVTNKEEKAEENETSHSRSMEKRHAVALDSNVDNTRYCHDHTGALSYPRLTGEKLQFHGNSVGTVS